MLNKNKYPIRAERQRRKRDAGKRPNILPRNASWPKNPRSAARRAAQDLVLQIRHHSNLKRKRNNKRDDEVDGVNDDGNTANVRHHWAQSQDEKPLKIHLVAWGFVIKSIFYKEVTLVSRTQPSGPLCLWQCLKHVPSTLRLNGTPLIQKASRDEHGTPTDLLWCKWESAHGVIQLTFMTQNEKVIIFRHIGVGGVTIDLLDV